MSIEDFIIEIFCLIDDELKKLLNGKNLRERGPAPSLADSEVLTMEIVGEFLGEDRDKGIWQYFKMHWSHLFPKIPDRTNFAKQAAKLHIVKRMLQKNLAEGLGALSDRLHSIDGFPMPVCKFARANFSSLFKGEAAYEYCATKKETYYGFRGHLVISSQGVISGATFTASNVDERDICPEIVERILGLLLGDKGYIRPELKELLAARGLNLETPLKDNMTEERPKEFVKWIVSKRRLIETVIGQLVDRFILKKHEQKIFDIKLLVSGGNH